VRRFVAADRFVDAQLWWVASELCRRHPRLRMREIEHGEIGTFLEVVAWPDADDLRIRLSRAAGMEIFGHADFCVATPELLAAANPHQVVKRLEAAHGIGDPELPPSTTRETIGYRAIAQALAMMVNSRHSRTVRGERPEDPSVVHGGAWLEQVLAWPSIPGLRERWALDAAHDALYQKAPAHAWLLMRDLEPVAVLDLYGQVHTEGGVADLYGAYREAGSNLVAAVVEVLGEAMRL
jgi:hypothetical protein